MMTDPIADLLGRIRNAAMARHELTRLPASKLKKSVAELLKKEGYVSDVRQEEWGPKKHQTLTIVLKYATTGSNERTSAFQGIRRVSRPGRRVYVGHDQIPRVLRSEERRVGKECRSGPTPSPSDRAQSNT